MPDSIVLGYDGGVCAGAALEEALRLCRDLDAELTVVFGYAPLIPERQTADYREALHELGEREAGKALERAREAGVSARADVRSKRPADALVEVADELDARMIVVGSHGEHLITAALLGSTPHRLLAFSQRPVLVVRT
jgi:nucleotide-binding universal stress UspA family protein